MIVQNNVSHLTYKSISFPPFLSIKKITQEVAKLAVYFRIDTPDTFFTQIMLMFHAEISRFHIGMIFTFTHSKKRPPFSLPFRVSIALQDRELLIERKPLLCLHLGINK